MRLSLVSILLALLCGDALADRMGTHSFEPPYDDVDPTGNRIVSREWKNGGVTNVNSNFVRLTPDRQSKKGALWSRKSLGTDTFSTVLKFRISGQGKKFFGDGMALWCIQQPYYVEGDFHGSAERFTGFGVIFDTFKNTETLSYHRDVSLVWNDGTQSGETMLERKEGCDANIRYHEDRGDFSVDKASRAKIVVEGGKRITVLMDERNSGEFTSCLSAELPFEPDWSRQAHLGLSASTGQLADNHDVLSLITYSNPQKHAEDEALMLMTPRFARGEGITEERFQRLEDSVNELLDKFSYLEHHIEHELASVEDHIKVTTSKLQAQEAVSEGRIDELYHKMVDNVQGSFEDRLTQLEKSLDKSLTSRLMKAESIMNERITQSVSDSVDQMGGWKLPFFFLLLVIAGCGVGLYMWYKRLKKMHMLGKKGWKRIKSYLLAL